MDLMDLLILLLLVLSTPSLAVVGEFHFVNKLKTWTEAQSYCRERFWDLATIERAEDSQKFQEMAAKSGHWGAWIGLYDDVKSWRWSLDNTSLYKEELGSWFVFEEDNDQSTEHCAVVYQNGLRDTNCEQRLFFVCYEAPLNYILVEQTKTWQSAQDYCRQTYTDLASVRNQQELKTIMDMVQTYECWIGLSRDGWKWSDLSDSSFRKWGGGGEPNGGNASCGGLAGAGWYDDDCLKKYPFVCSGQPTKVLRVTLQTDGSVNMNDPLVQEAVLEQMEKDLRGLEVHQGLRLRWRKLQHGDVFRKPEL